MQSKAVRRFYSVCLLLCEQLLLFAVFYVIIFRIADYISCPSCSLFEHHRQAAYLCTIIIFSVVFGLLQLSFVRAVFTNAGRIPEIFLASNLAEVNSRYSFHERDNNGNVRKCKKCSKIKPDRTHHCSRCDSCVLKMDHHCPFLANCIGFRNYKFFCLTLLWISTLSFLTVLFGGFCIFEIVDGHGDTLDYFIVVTTGIGVVALLVFLPFTANHIRFVFSNSTTLEHLEKRRNSKNNPYHLGWAANFTQVFGSNPLFWFIPLATSKGDGLSFPLQHSHEESSLLFQTQR